MKLKIAFILNKTLPIKKKKVKRKYELSLNYEVSSPEASTIRKPPIPRESFTPYVKRTTKPSKRILHAKFNKSMENNKNVKEELEVALNRIKELEDENKSLKTHIEL